MDRKDKIAREARRGRVDRVSDLNVVAIKLHSDYVVEPCDGQFGETGKLEVLKLIHKAGSGPDFVARWDQAPRELDFDLRNAPPADIKKFKRNKNGYGGHHSQRSSLPNARAFDVQITTPAGVIFDGTVSFCCHFRMPAETGHYPLQGNDATLSAPTKPGK